MEMKRIRKKMGNTSISSGKSNITSSNKTSAVLAKEEEEEEVAAAAAALVSSLQSENASLRAELHEAHHRRTCELQALSDVCKVLTERVRQAGLGVR